MSLPLSSRPKGAPAAAADTTKIEWTAITDTQGVVFLNPAGGKCKVLAHVSSGGIDPQEPALDAVFHGNSYTV